NKAPVRTLQELARVRALLCPAHVSRQPALVHLAQLGERERRFARDGELVAAHAADNTSWQREHASALANAVGVLGRNLDEIAALVFAEPDRMGRQLAFVV